ncbi:hypothetical protein HJC99_04545 [Candidatus Saccharibacteria bacterium]|nr:hypothetical protein [Candidatus Saccharibacteria bacterium]
MAWFNSRNRFRIKQGLILSKKHTPTQTTPVNTDGVYMWGGDVYAEKWGLKIVRHGLTGYVSIDEATFSRYAVGQQYPGPDKPGQIKQLPT